MSLRSIQVYLSWCSSVTHIVAASRDGCHYAGQASAGRAVLSTSWLIKSCEVGVVLDPLPHDYLHLSADALRRFVDSGETDLYGDS